MPLFKACFNFLFLRSIIKSSGGNIFSSAFIISSSFNSQKYGISLLKFKINSKISWFYFVISTFSWLIFYSIFVVSIFYGEMAFRDFLSFCISIGFFKGFKDDLLYPDYFFMTVSAPWIDVSYDRVISIELSLIT